MINGQSEATQNPDSRLEFAPSVDFPTGASGEVIDVFASVFNDAINKYGRPTIHIGSTATYGLSLWLGTEDEVLEIFRPYDKSFVSANIEKRITDERGKRKDSVRKLLLNSDGELLTTEERDIKHTAYSPVTGDGGVSSFLNESKGMINRHTNFAMRLRSLGRRAIAIPVH